jgi:hypothetical protein
VAAPSTSNQYSLGFYPKLAIVILLAIAMAEAAPEAVNAVLVLILLGLILGHWAQFSGLAKILGSVK